MQDHIIYAAAWLSFGLGHSLLASNCLKSRLNTVFGSYYRLCYNLFAALHFAAVIAVGRIHVEAGGYQFNTNSGYALIALQVLGWIVLIWGCKGYDWGLFAGFKQIRDRRLGLNEAETEPLVMAGLHRYVRHPIYSGVFLILWGWADGERALATAVWGSVYLLVGTCFEERKLLDLYGQAYRDYRQRVPAFIPWKGRAI
ncbi:MAG: isoprenylcysteine carboxylmethyltransferase family protein [Rhodospirillales bacterium]